MNSVIAGADRPKLESLTGLRYLAAALVTAGHFSVHTSMPAEPSFWTNLVGVGYLAVNFFFVLSGFVLAWNYLDQAGRLRESPREFWLARFARVYPAYALSLVLSLPAFYAALQGRVVPAGAMPLEGAWGPAATVVTTPLLLQGWFGLLAWNDIGWTLSVEAFFYLVFPFLGPRVSKARLLPAFVGLWLATLLPVWAYCVWLNADVPWGAAWYPSRMSTLTEGFLYGSPLVHLPEFLMGVVLAQIHRTRPALSGARMEYASLCLSAGAIAAASALPGPIFVRLTLPALALIVLCGATGRSAPMRLMASGPMRLLGEASYSVYLFQLVVLQVLVAAVTWKAPGALLPWTLYPLYLAALTAFSVGVFWGVESPARRWIRARWGSSRGGDDRPKARAAAR